MAVPIDNAFIPSRGPQQFGQPVHSGDDSHPTPATPELARLYDARIPVLHENTPLLDTL